MSAHVIARLRERYGIEAGPRDVQAILAACFNRGMVRAKMIRADGAVVFHFVVQWKGQLILPVVTETAAGEKWVSTVLPITEAFSGVRRRRRLAEGARSGKKSSRRRARKRGKKPA